VKPKKLNPRAAPPSLAAADPKPNFEVSILRLVKGARECRAIKAGEVDAVLDPASGRAILLPEAQAAVLERKARFRSLVELATDGHWEQDKDYRFIAHTGVPIGSAHADESLLGKTLWELPFDNGTEIDWTTYRTQLEWRAIFRDLELRCVDGAGRLRIISVSGEPIFDAGGQFKGYRGITRDVTERKQADAGAPGSDRFAQATLDALSAQVCVLDVSGTILTANAAWRGFTGTHAGIGAGVAEGSNYLAACGEIAGNERVDAAAIAAGLRQVIAGERERFRYQYFCDAPTGGSWLMATVTRLSGDGAARAIVAQEDISEIVYAERLLRLEYDVARCLADSNETSTALRAVIRAVCDAQHWDCGQYYRLDSAADELRLEESWGRNGARVEQFMERSRGAVIRPGAGLAGRVCQSGEPLWALSGSKDARTSLTAVAHEAGMDGAFVFPVLAEGDTIGVLAFASGIVREPDHRLLQAARNIGTQLGQFLQRRQAEETLHRSELRFRRLTELSADWYWEQDREFRFAKMVGAGMTGIKDVLGRTLWELPAIVVSDEEWVTHKSQLAAQWSFCDFEFAVALPDGRFSYYLISGEPLYDEAGAFTGFQGTGVDITQRKRAEILLREAAPPVVV
jgi:PAS domain S-box-containing protein